MKNEPIEFADRKVTIGLSTTADGNIRTVEKAGAALRIARENRVRFLKRVGLNLDDTVLVMVDYDTTNFARYAVVDDRDRGDGMAINHDTKTTRHTAPHDALFTKTKKLGLFLPLADCLGAVIYDDEYGVLGVSHLGRQAAEQYGATKTIRYMVDNFGSNPAKLKIWLSPAAGKANYPLWNRNNMGLAEANMSDF